MRIPRYWAIGEANGPDRLGKRVDISCWHWSDKSVEEAKALAVERARALVTRLATTDFVDLQRYGYGVRPMREEIVSVIQGPKGGEAAIITRNIYGALVLNAARAMFMDIDFGEGEEDRKKPKKPGLFSRLFGTKKPPQDPQPATAEEQALERIEQWAGKYQASLRIYRTRAGLRCLVTDSLYDPTDPAVEVMMNELNCDPLYITLCRRQECFRARLTPKPWRCGAPNPPASYPFWNAHLEKAYREWIEEYNYDCEGYDVCRLVTTIGAQVHPEIAPLIKLHDQHCIQNTGQDLA